MHIYSIDPFAGRPLQTFEALIEICHASLRQMISAKYQNGRYFSDVLDVLQ